MPTGHRISITHDIVFPSINMQPVKASHSSGRQVARPVQVIQLTRSQCLLFFLLSATAVYYYSQLNNYYFCPDALPV